MSGTLLKVESLLPLDVSPLPHDDDDSPGPPKRKPSIFLFTPESAKSHSNRDATDKERKKSSSARTPTDSLPVEQPEATVSFDLIEALSVQTGIALGTRKSVSEAQKESGAQRILDALLKDEPFKLQVSEFCKKVEEHEHSLADIRIANQFLTAGYRKELSSISWLTTMIRDKWKDDANVIDQSLDDKDEILAAVVNNCLFLRRDIKQLAKDMG